MEKASSLFDRVLNTTRNEIWDSKKEGNKCFPGWQVCLAYAYFFNWLQAGYAYKRYAYEKKHVHAIKAMRPSLHASCCAYKLFWLCYESNCMKGESRKYVRDVDQMGWNAEKKNYCKLQFFWENKSN